MMFSEKIPELSRKSSHPCSGSQRVGHREGAGGGCDIKMPMAAVAGGDFGCVATRDDDTAQSSGLDGPGLQRHSCPICWPRLTLCRHGGGSTALHGDGWTAQGTQIMPRDGGLIVVGGGLAWKSTSSPVHSS